MKKKFHTRILIYGLVAAALLSLVFFLARTPHTNTPGGVALSFDDRASIESWGKARDFLKSHGIKATFFVDRVYALSPEQLNILQLLVSDGHEIGSHGFKHRNAETLLESGLSVEEYLRTEILPSIEQLEMLGFEARSFAYPHGAFTEETDRALQEYFVTIRKVGSDGMYHSRADAPFIGAFYIDERGSDRAFFEPLIKKAHDSGTIVSLSGHHLAPNGGRYICSFETLETVAVLADQYGLKFYTMSELAEMD